MIQRVTFHRFKKFRDKTFDILPSVVLLAGGNNSGKTTLIQGLAIWEFCRTVLEMERGKASLCAGANHQGVGLSDDEFLPVNLPSLKHLWTNLKNQKDQEADGYTLWIDVEWKEFGGHNTYSSLLELTGNGYYVPRFSQICIFMSPDSNFTAVRETIWRFDVFPWILSCFQIDTCQRSIKTF